MIVSYTLKNLHNIIKHPHTAVALGYFDGIHLGHKAVIDRAVSYKQQGYAACVFTFTMSSARPKSKGNSKMIMPGDIKEAEFEKLGVDYLIAPDFEEFMQLTADAFVKDILKGTLRASAICCGQNFKLGRGGTTGVKELETICQKYGIALNLVDPVSLDGQMVSSTRIRSCIANGDIKQANRLLGKPFELDGIVVKGRQLGRTIEVPTINQVFGKEQLLPRFGVYASLVHIDGRFLPGVTNIGIKPTVGSDYPLSETYIIGFDGDLYGQNIHIYLLDYLRGERKFDSLEQLKGQINIDVKKTLDVIMHLD